MQRKIILAITVLLTLLLGGYFLFGYLTTSSISVVLDEQLAQKDPTVIVDEYVIQKDGTGKYRVDVGAGKHLIQVRLRGYEKYREERSTFVRTSVDLLPKLKELSADEIALSLFKDTSDVLITDAKLYGNNDWLVFKTNSKDGKSEGGTTVARYNNIASSWQIIADGTAIYLKENKSEAPPELIADLKGVLED